MQSRRRSGDLPHKILMTRYVFITVIAGFLFQRTD
jgi:hypothetical protein